MSEELRNTISNEEQQLYIDAQYELRELERKTKVEDNEYQNMLNNIRSNNDAEQLQQFLNDYISVSDYENGKRENEAWINEINEKYGITSDREALEDQIEATRKRQQLVRLKKYYERHGSNVMRDVDVTGLTDSDVLREYDRITFGIDNETLSNMLNDDIRSRFGDRNDGNNGGNEVGTADNDSDTESNDGNSNDDGDISEVEEAISEFKDDCGAIKEQLDEIKRSLVLEDGLELSDAIRDLTSELGELSRASDDLIRLMDDFKLVNENAIFSMDPVEIKATIKGFKDRLKEIKQHQIDKYNARVESTNKLLEELRNMDGIEIEIPENISRCDIDITDWRSIKYLEQIDYNKLVEINKLIADVKEKTKTGNGVGDNTDSGTGSDDNKPTDLESDMASIEQEIAKVESQIGEGMTLEEIEKIKQEINKISNRVIDFRTKLENEKDTIQPAYYDNYLDRLNDAEANLADLYLGLGKDKDINDEKSNDYKELMEKLDKLNQDVIYCNNMIESLYGHLSENGTKVFEDQLNTYEGRLEEIKNDIEDRYKNGKLDENQYNELNKKVEEIEQLLKASRDKNKEPGMIADVDIFAFLNKKIDGVENSIYALETLIASVGKPIKRETRKQIDKIIEQIEEEIKFIETELEKAKEENPEKYEELKERLNIAKERLEQAGKNYRKNCPLLVRAVKGAKAFYKKHKKACLVVAGLAAIALLHATVGPVLIPAIMHGNIMVGRTAPFLSGFTNFVNNILGGMIGATKTVKDTWLLANGVRITPSLASSSLLKGLAISGIGTTALVAPLVVGIKKLVEKMKKSELKEKLVEGKDKIKDKLSRNNDDEKEKKSPGKGKTKAADKKTIEELAKLLKDYRKSGMSLDEYCEANEISEEDKKMIEMLESRSKDNIETLNNSGRKGR